MCQAVSQKPAMLSPIQLWKALMQIHTGKACCITVDNHQQPGYATCNTYRPDPRTPGSQPEAATQSVIEQTVQHQVLITR